MNDLEVRVRCIEAASRVPGNPNTIQQARAFYEFVTEGDGEAELEVVGDETSAGIVPTTRKKPSRK